MILSNCINVADGQERYLYGDSIFYPGFQIRKSRLLVSHKTSFLITLQKFGRTEPDLPFWKDLTVVTYERKRWSFFRIDPSDILHRYAATAGTDPDIDIPDGLQDLSNRQPFKLPFESLFFLEPEDQF